MTKRGGRKGQSGGRPQFDGGFLKRARSIEMTSGANRRSRSNRSRIRSATQPSSRPRRFGYWVLVICTWGFIGLAGIVSYYALDLPDIAPLTQAKNAPSLTLLSWDGEPAALRGSGAGGLTSLHDLPSYVPAAVIATEDRRFYSHYGLDPIGLMRAAFANIWAGKIVQGGSTITQQLAKNLFLRPERTLERKVQELILAVWLETQFTKDEILELYLNRVYFGAGAYGVEAAAQRYFGKSIREVSLSEAALLAGLLKAPTYYAPTSNPSGAQARAQLVIDNMVRAGYLDETERALVADEAMALTQRAGTPDIFYFADWVAARLPELVNDPRGDLMVRTTIDLELQRRAEQVVAEALARDGANLGVSQAALIALAPDGAVRAMVGGRTYLESQFNRAVQARRQPGSAFKPFVYLTAIEAGLTPDTVREDGPIMVGGWQPKNFSETYAGPVTLMEAVARSLNTVAVRVTEEIGRDNVIQTARRLGITANLEPHPSIALGVFEVSLIELAAAYTPFANGGYAVFPHAIEEVNSSGGQVLYSRTRSELGRAVSLEAVGSLNVMLSHALRTGTGKRAYSRTRSAAGKTGTSQDFRDAWFVGYTTDLVVGVWVGNDDGTPTNRVTGGTLPAAIWQDFMTRAQSGSPPRELPGIDLIAPELESDFDRDYAPPGKRQKGFFERLFGL